MFNNKPSVYKVLGPVGEIREKKAEKQVLMSEMPVPVQEEKDEFAELKLEDERVVNLLRENFDTMVEVIQATDAQFLSIKGIGPARLTGIRKAIEEWLGL
jgi:DNA-directed RNA polymerase alpha subunit